MSGKVLQYRKGKEPSSVLRSFSHGARSKSWACTSDNGEIQQRARRYLNSAGQVSWSDDRSSEGKENLDDQGRSSISRTVSSPSLLKKQARRPREILGEIACGEKGDDVRKSTLGQSKQGKKCQHGSNSKEAQLDQSRTVTK